MLKKTSWQLITEGDFVGACEIADQEYARTGDLSALRKKIFALLNTGKLTEVVSVCDKLINAPSRWGKVDSDFIKCGVALWLMGEPNKAIDKWRDSKMANYTDAAGGLTAPMLLFYAAVKLEDNELKNQATMLMSNIKTSSFRMGWPAPVGLYLLGISSEEDVFRELSQQPILRQRQLCTAHFHFGVKHMKADAIKSAEHMSLAVQGCPSIMLEAEYYLAKGELGNRNP